MRKITTTDESEIVSSFPGISRLVTLDTSQQNNIKIVALEEFDIMAKQSDLSNKDK